MKSLAELEQWSVGDPGEPYALLADLHGNAAALEAVEAWLDAHGIRQALVLGDLVGYGPQPGAVIERVRHRGWTALRGNHEQLLLGFDAGSRVVKPRALASLAWSREQISAADRDYLASLPLALALCAGALAPGIAVHGSLVDPEHCFAYLYDLSLDLNVRQLRELGAVPGTHVFHGHTHKPAVFAVRGSESEALALIPGQRLHLAPGVDHFINPGSVGYPRDGDLRGSFFVLRHRELEIVRVDYDLETTARLIEEAGYDRSLAERLRSAR